MNYYLSNLFRAGIACALSLASSCALAHAFVDTGLVYLKDLVTTSEVTKGDFDGDGRTDVLFCHGDNELLFRRQTADGRLVPWLDLPAWSANANGGTLTKCNQMEVADLNSDGRSDAVIVHDFGITTLISQESGFARHEAEIPFAGHEHRAVSGALLDLDVDGTPDLVIATPSGALRWWRGTSPGRWEPERSLKQAQGSGAVRVRAGDMNSDGRTDLVVGSQDFGAPRVSRLELFTNPGSGQLADGVLIPMPPLSEMTNFEIGDVNSDGRDDLVVLGRYWELIAYPQAETGGLGSYFTFPVYRNAHAIAFDDMDQDGMTDILLNHAGWLTVTSYRQTPDGFTIQSFTPLIPNIQAENQSLATADFDGDGCKDIVAAVSGGYHLLRGVDCSREVVMDPTGTWYDPDQDGHGLQIQLQADGRLLAFWYTFDPQGNRAYFIADGGFNGRTGLTYNFRPLGSYFPPNYRASEVNMQLFGEMRLSFDSCADGVAHFDLPYGFGRGSMRLTRLTQPVGVDCQGVATSTASGPLAGATGTWYDPNLDGQGIVLEALPGGWLLATWFTQSPRPVLGQTWLTAIGPIEGNQANLTVHLTSGGRFIPNFDPAQIVRQPLGTLTVTLDDCRYGQASWNLGGGYGRGSMLMHRLSTPVATRCPAP